jgi:hypothetical protein
VCFQRVLISFVYFRLIRNQFWYTHTHSLIISRSAFQFTLNRRCLVACYCGEGAQVHCNALSATVVPSKCPSSQDRQGLRCCCHFRFALRQRNNKDGKNDTSSRNDCECAMILLSAGCNMAPQIVGWTHHNDYTAPDLPLELGLS